MPNPLFRTTSTIKTPDELEELLHRLQDNEIKPVVVGRDAMDEPFIAGLVGFEEHIGVDLWGSAGPFREKDLTFPLQVPILASQP